MLKINDLTVKVSTKMVLNKLSLSINDGEVHVIMGKNGIGKSTLCKVIMRDTSYEIEDGSIIFDGKDLLKMDTSDVAKEGIMLISQNPPAIEGITNAEMLRASLSEKEGKNINIFEFNKNMEEVCNKLSLDKSFIHKEINMGASGGERKKIELLHMGLLKPKFIILDELDSGLDVDAIKVVSSYINDYHKETKCSILIITHHPNIINYIKPNYIHVLDEGKIVKTGDSSLASIIEETGFSKANTMIQDKESE